MLKPQVLLFFAVLISLPASAQQPVRYAIYGLTHDHAGGFLPGAKSRNDIVLAGIIEPRVELAASYARRFSLDTNLLHTSLDSLLARTNIEAVATFTSTFEHRAVEDLCHDHVQGKRRQPFWLNLSSHYRGQIR